MQPRRRPHDSQRHLFLHELHQSRAVETGADERPGAQEPGGRVLPVSEVRPLELFSVPCYSANKWDESVHGGGVVNGAGVSMVLV